MPLDDDFIKDTAFRLNNGENIMLRPDLEAWEDYLVKQERSSSYWGCSLLIFGSIGLLWLAQALHFRGFAWPILLLLIVVFLFRRVRQIYHTRQLRQHGLFSYELKEDRIVRYHDTHHEVFYYHELDNMVEERYGLRLEKGIAWYEWLWPRILQNPGKRLLILPGYFPAYEGYLNYLREGK